MLQVVHGGDNDCLWLQRDAHLYLANVFDTDKASKVSKLRSTPADQVGIACPEPSPAPTFNDLDTIFQKLTNVQHICDLKMCCRC